MKGTVPTNGATHGGESHATRSDTHGLLDRIGTEPSRGAAAGACSQRYRGCSRAGAGQPAAGRTHRAGPHATDWAAIRARPDAERVGDKSGAMQSDPGPGGGPCGSGSRPVSSSRTVSQSRRRVSGDRDRRRRAGRAARRVHQPGDCHRGKAATEPGRRQPRGSTS